MATKTKQRDMIEVLTSDHREIERLFTELSDTTDAKRRRRLTDVVIAELVRHAIAEEQYLYPTARRVLPDGNELADSDVAEHQAAEVIMKRLERTSPTDVTFEPLMRELMSRVREHIHDEETNLFPKLRNACTADEMRELGRKLEIAKAAAPTRPHPMAPNTPPWNQLLAPATSLLDQVRDALTGRPTSRGDL